MLGLFSKKPDVIGVSETELKENQHELNNISAYNFLFNNSNGSASLVDCTRKKFFVWGCGLFVSDVISGGLLGHLGPLFLALGTNC